MSADGRVIVSACQFAAWEDPSPRPRPRVGHGDRPEQWCAIYATQRLYQQPGSDGSFEGRGLAVHGLEMSGGEMKVPGVELDSRLLRTSVTRERYRRLHGALSHLLSRGKANGVVSASDASASGHGVSIAMWTQEEVHQDVGGRANETVSVTAEQSRAHATEAAGLNGDVETPEEDEDLAYEAARTTYHKA